MYNNYIDYLFYECGFPTFLRIHGFVGDLVFQDLASHSKENPVVV